jgi:magnesium-transporting ATPase (P-type)
MFTQGQVIEFGYGGGIILVLVVIVLLIAYLRRPESSADKNVESNDWPDESLPVMTPLKTVLTEGFHALLMFLFTIPFYLYGGNVLYDHVLLTSPDETMAFIIRAAITVLIAELFFNWIPYLGFRLTFWRKRLLYVVLSGLTFALLTVFVIQPPYHEQEADIGMGIVWVLSGVLVHQLFRKLGWY